MDIMDHVAAIAQGESIYPSLSKKKLKGHDRRNSGYGCSFLDAMSCDPILQRCPPKHYNVVSGLFTSVCFPVALLASNVSRYV